MSLIEVRNEFRRSLNNLYSVNEIDFYFKSVLRSCLDIDPIDIALRPNLEVEKNQMEILDKILLELSEEKPLQYIIGEMSFRSVELNVNPLVLIPRPETEELVGWVLEDYEHLERETNLVDFGTGSGCIAISLKKEQALFSVLAVDLDESILELVKENAKKNHVQIQTLQADMNSLDQLEMEVEVIVSNPPYIVPNEKEEMKKNVLAFEPHQALFVPKEDPLKYYRHILIFAQHQLKSKGRIYFEINPNYLNELEGLILSFSNYTVKKRLDIFGKARMLRIEKQ